MTKPQRIELTEAQISELLERVESGRLAPGDYEIIKAMAETISYLSHVVDEKGVQLGRLLRSLFGSSSEKRDALFPAVEESPPADTAQKRDAAPAEATTSDPAPSSEREAKKGHGRRAASDYTGAEVVEVANEELEPGNNCPECEKGTVYEQAKPKTIVRVRGSAPLRATIYRLQRLRCGLCGAIFTARVPQGVGDSKYDETVASGIALLKYGSGLPFHRLECLQRSHGIPLPASTQWEIIHRAQTLIAPAYDELFRQAAQGEILYSDDTKVRILELMGERLAKLQDPPERTGLFTTGLVSRLGERTIALYFSGSRHAGENLAKLLSIRDGGLDPPIHMSDGLSRNQVSPGMAIVANCLTHGRRQFIDVLESFPQEVRYVVDVLAEVYAVDHRARTERLDPQSRLLLHQKESGPRMEELKRWLREQTEQRKVEPNSSLGKAFKYILRRWEPLTLFLRKPGAPLDNNICERALKKAILNRKNSLFFKTRHGAEIGDRYLSLIHTSELSGVNAFEYLNALQRHSSPLAKRPEEWMPWNFQDAIARTGNPAVWVAR